MNYFELFDMPLSFVLDDNVVKNRYDALIDQYRPEVTAGNEETGDSDDEKIALLEAAYVVFQSQDLTIAHVLELKNFLPDDGYEYSQQFMMEVRDINEELMELELDENGEQLMEVEQKTNTLMIKIYEDITPVIESYEEDTATEETLLQVKDFYYQKKYLERILDRIKVIRNIATP